jgi:hypothetical protein
MKTCVFTPSHETGILVATSSCSLEAMTLAWGAKARGRRCRRTHLFSGRWSINLFAPWIERRLFRGMQNSLNLHLPLNINCQVGVDMVCLSTTMRCRLSLLSHGARDEALLCLHIGISFSDTFDRRLYLDKASPSTYMAEEDQW